MIQRLLLILAFVLATCLPVQAQPVFDAASSNLGTASSTLTISHPLAAGSDRTLFCMFSSSGNSVLVTSATYDGDAMTELYDDNSSPSFAQIGLYLIKESGGLATGTANVVATFGSSTDTSGACLSFSNVDQTTPNDSVDSVNLEDNNPANTVAGATGDLIAEWTICTGGDPTSATTANSERVDRFDFSFVLTLAQTAASAASVAMDWTVNTGQCAAYRSVAVNLNAASGGAGPSLRAILLMGVGLQ